jgi:hypothetical protein
LRFLGRCSAAPLSFFVIRRLGGLECEKEAAAELVDGGGHPMQGGEKRDDDDNESLVKLAVMKFGRSKVLISC